MSDVDIVERLRGPVPSILAMRVPPYLDVSQMYLQVQALQHAG